MPAVFSDEEISAVKLRYPGLERTGPGAVEGILEMDAVYDGEPLKDSFQVRITAMNPNSFRVPALYEIGKRTEAIAEKLGLTDLRTLHRNKDGTACVCVKQIEKRMYPPGSSLFIFVEELAVPYLYGLVHYEHNRVWPWGDYSHGSMGLLEFYAEDTTPQIAEDIMEIFSTIRKELNWKEYHKQLRKPSAERSCLCGSGRPFRVCHKKAWGGLQHLHSEMTRLNFNFGVLFEGVKK